MYLPKTKLSDLTQILTPSFAHTHNFNIANILFCSRCFGLYFGSLGWALLFVLWQAPLVFYHSITIIPLLASCFFLTLPLILDWGLQCLALRHSSNISRSITGLLTSLAGVIMISAFNLIWLVVPVGLVWFLIVSRIGIKWRASRALDWGCADCQNQEIINNQNSGLETNFSFVIDFNSILLLTAVVLLSGIFQLQEIWEIPILIIAVILGLIFLIFVLIGTTLGCGSCSDPSCGDSCGQSCGDSCSTSCRSSDDSSNCCRSSSSGSCCSRSSSSSSCCRSRSS